MVVSTILAYSGLLNLIQTLLFGASLLLLGIFLLLSWLDPMRFRINHPLPRIGGLLMAIALALQVVVRSAEGEALMTVLAFAVFCYVIYVHFVKRRSAR